MAESDKIVELIGELLAAGYSDAAIVKELTKTETLTTEEAFSLLREVYEKWQEAITSLDLQPTDLLNWHMEQRHRLLRETIVAEKHREALAILDSMATLKGLSGALGTPTTPLTINLLPKEETDAS